jgi:hypothetical protein
VDGLATPLHQPMAHSRLPRGQGLPEVPSGLLAVVVSHVCREKKKLPGALLSAGGFS